MPKENYRPFLISTLLVLLPMRIVLQGQLRKKKNGSPSGQRKGSETERDRKERESRFRDGQTRLQSPNRCSQRQAEKR